jgi:membrane protein DedA with SNARE-associated domain
LNTEAINEMTNQLVKIVETAPMWLSVSVLFFATWIEYIFPPFPGDTILVAGGFFAARGAISPYETFIVLVLGSTSGCVIAWWIGHGALRFPQSRNLLLKLIKSDQLTSLENLYKRYGILILAFNRFLPGVRGFFMIAAGLAQIPLRLVVIWGTISAMFWNALLMMVGLFFSDNLESLLNLVNNYTKVMLSLLGTLSLVWLMFKLLKKKKSIRNKF